MADPKKLPAYLGGYDPNKPETLGYFPAFYPGQLDALASQMAQGYGAATMQPTWGGPINAANGLPMAGVPNNPALGQFGAAIPAQVLTGPTAADYRADLLKIYTPMGSAVPKPVTPVSPPPPPATTPKPSGGGGGGSNKGVSGTVVTPAVKKKIEEDAKAALKSGSYSSNLNKWQIKNGKLRYYNTSRW